MPVNDGASTVADDSASTVDVPPTTYAKHLVHLEPRSGGARGQPNLPTLKHATDSLSERQRGKSSQLASHERKRTWGLVARFFS